MTEENYKYRTSPFLLRNQFRGEGDYRIPIIKDFFLTGYNEMLRQVEPERIICYNEPFPEMQGNIVFVDYELSSWKYQNDPVIPPKLVMYIYGELPIPEDSGIMIKTGYVMSYDEEKGMGSAYGGKWKPKKPEDERYLGEPGEIKTTWKDGYRVDTKIEEDGRAVMERHYSIHYRADKHTNPHDHKILWDPERGNPLPQGPINYPDGAPEFKSYKGVVKMDGVVIRNTPEENRFKIISEFIWCVNDGGEVVFEWKGKLYSITHPEGRSNIGEGYYRDEDGEAYNYLSHEKCEDVEGLWADTADEILEYIVGGDRLRDVITKVRVLDRTL